MELANRCDICHLRGHGLWVRGCPGGEVWALARLRAAFEECADKGFTTKLRYEDALHGFLPFDKPECAGAHDYRELMRLPVLEALEKTAPLIAARLKRVGGRPVEPESQKD